MNAESNLGTEETQARMGLLARYTKHSENPERDQAITRVLLQGVGRRWPMAALDNWLQLAGSTQEFTRAAFPQLKERILNAGMDAVETLKWTHHFVRPLPLWEPADIQALERTDNAEVRDAYWALQRQGLQRAKRVGGRS